MIAQTRRIEIEESDDAVALPGGRIDLAGAESAVRSLLTALGEDPDREGLADTPRRVAKMYLELFAGLSADPAGHLQRVFHERYDEIVLLRDINFFSLL